MSRQQRQLTEEQKRDRALLSVMRDWPLEPGQMLFLGPKSVAALTGGGYDPRKLTNCFVLQKEEWLGPEIRKTGTANSTRSRPKSHRGMGRQ